MNLKKYLIAVVVAYVIYSALAVLIHEVTLKADYEPLVGSVLRSVEGFGQRAPLLYLGNLFFALAFCLIYVKGYEPGKAWFGQGLRFGLIMGTLLASVALTEYVVYPVPGGLGVKWIVFGYLQMVITGVVAAAVYRTQP